MSRLPVWVSQFWIVFSHHVVICDVIVSSFNSIPLSSISAFIILGVGIIYFDVFIATQLYVQSIFG